MPTYEQFETFLQSRIRALESISFNSKVVESKSNKTQNKQSKTTTVHAHQTNKKLTCPVCKNDHKIYVCKSFQEMSVVERESFITKNSRCSNCLAKNHSSSNCPSKGVCKFCGKKHHYLLHRENKNNANESNNLNYPSTSGVGNSELSSPSPSNVTNHLNASDYCQSSSILLATARVTIQAENGRQIRVRALLY